MKNSTRSLDVVNVENTGRKNDTEAVLRYHKSTPKKDWRTKASHMMCTLYVHTYIHDVYIVHTRCVDCMYMMYTSYIPVHDVYIVRT